MKKTLNNVLKKEVVVEVVDNQKDADFITHAGTFHADEVMATVFLLNKFGSIKLCRVNKVSNHDAFIYDIGFGKYDHHQSDFDKTRENGIKYASCGLVWEEFGKDIAKLLNVKDEKQFFDTIDKNLVMDIDRDDNGQSVNITPDIKIQNIPNLIGSFNPNWDCIEDEDLCFLNAVSFANTIFNNLVENILSKESAREVVEQKISESKNHILLLDKYMPWKDIVLTSKNEKAKEVLYAVFPSKRGGYNVVATPKASGSFDVKKPFPKSWSGKEKQELKTISKVDTITFCHKGLFICACDTYEDAIKIAEIAVNNEEDV